MLYVTPMKKRLLLSSVCALALFSPQLSEARRLLPEMPSVEVHVEALEALRYSAQASGTASGWQKGPEGKIITQAVGYPSVPPAQQAQMPVASAPAPQPQPQMAQTPPAAVHIPPVVAKEPKPEPQVAKTPVIMPQEMVKKEPVTLPAPAPITAPKMAPVEVVKRPPAPLPVPVPPIAQDVAKKEPPKQIQPMPPLELSPLPERKTPSAQREPEAHELASLPPLQPEPSMNVEKALEKELEELPPLSPAKDVMPPLSADLPEPDVKSMEPLTPLPLPVPPVAKPLPQPSAVKEVKSELKKVPEEQKTAEKKAPEKPMPPKMPEIKAEPIKPVPPKVPEVQEKKVVIKAPEKKEIPSLEELGLPGIEEEGTKPAEDALLPLPPMEEKTAAKQAPTPPEKMPESKIETKKPVPEVTQKAALETPSAATAPDALPPLPELDEMAPPPVADKAPATKTTTPPVAKKEEEKGMFSGLSGMISGMLGDEEEKKPVAPAPKPAAKVEAAPVAPPPVMEEEMAALPPLPDADIPPANAKGMELPSLPGNEPEALQGKASELPSLDAVTSKTEEKEDALAFVRGKTDGATALPSLSQEELPASPKKEIQVAKSPAKEALPLPLPTPDAPPAKEPKDEPAPKAMTMNKVEKAELQIQFAKTETEVPLSSQAPLQALAKKLSAPGNGCGVTVVAFASGSDDQASIARRVSLSRALAIRAFLIDSGVDNLRINVQAMGNKADGNNPESADIFLKGC